MRRTAHRDGAWPAALSDLLRRGLGLALDRRLDELYRRLPATTCQRHGQCCSLLPPLQPAEIIVWLIRFIRTPQPERAQTASSLVRHFLLNAVQRRACPWALPGACADYEHRFLACRAYGLWSPRAYRERRRAAQEGQAAVTAAWAGLGIRLPEAVLAPGPEYCRHVRLCNDGENLPNLDPLLCNLEEALTLAALELPDQSGLMACHGDLGHLVARLALGERGCLEAKVAVTRAWVEDRREEALAWMDRSESQARAWACAAPRL